MVSSADCIYCWHQTEQRRHLCPEGNNGRLFSLIFSAGTLDIKGADGDFSGNWSEVLYYCPSPLPWMQPGLRTPSPPPHRHTHLSVVVPSKHDTERPVRGVRMRGWRIFSNLMPCPYFTPPSFTGRVFSVFSLFLVPVLTLRAWLCIASRALWFCLSQKVALPDWGRTGGTPAFFFPPTWTCVYAALLSHVESSHLILYLS